MKVLFINCVYEKGSTGKIIKDIGDYLYFQNIETYFAYGRGVKVARQNVIKFSSEIGAKINAFLSRLDGLQYGHSLFATMKLIRYIKKINPDIVHVHCINGYCVNIYKLINYLKEKNIRTVITQHAQFFYTGSCGCSYDCQKWKTGCGDCPIVFDATKSRIFDTSHKAYIKMQKAFFNFNNVILSGVSNWVVEESRQSLITNAIPNEIVYNGLDTSIFKKYNDRNLMREKYNIKFDEKVILHVTPSFKSPIKGGQYVLELAKRFIGEKTTFMIIGYDGNDIGLQKNIITIKHINDQVELAKIYSMADITLLTSRCETFSMVCAESLCCGTPVVGFMAKGPETISMKNFSSFVLYGDLNALENEIRIWINKKADMDINICEEAKKIYDKDIMAEKYLKLYKKLISY